MTTALPSYTTSRDVTRGEMEARLFMPILAPPEALPSRRNWGMMPLRGMRPEFEDVDISYEMKAPWLRSGIESFKFPAEESTKDFDFRIQPKKLDRISYLSFSRTLAKIAHSFLARKIGIESFNPTLIPIILGKNFDKIGALIGGANFYSPDIRLPHVRKGPPFYDIELETEYLGEFIYYIVNIKIFPFLNPPVYRVIAGTRKGPSLSLTL